MEKHERAMYQLKVANEKKKRFPRTLKGWFFFLLHKLTGKSFAQGSYTDNETGIDMPVFDVDAFKHYKNAFDPGEMVEVTEKIHGSNARFVFRDEHMFAGSRTQWKAENANCIWRKVLKAQPWIEEWCRAHPRYGLYGEVTPTQGEKFEYGSKEPQLFAFDIRTPEGTWLSREDIDQWPARWWVPILYTGPFDWEVIKTFVDGQTTVPGAKGIREGIVIRPVKERHVRGLGRLILK
jgi:RNA ligase (TIGR02306 family)